MISDNLEMQVQPAVNSKPEVTIFYYTGTGNSLWIARTLARELGNAEVLSLVGWMKNPYRIDSKIIGLVFPVHIWGVPRRILNFLAGLKTMSPEYIFAIANNAGQVSNTLVQLQKAMSSEGLTLSGGWSVIMPSNYIPWGGPGPLEKQNQQFAAARTKLKNISQEIKNRRINKVEKGPLWQRIIFTRLYNLSFPYVHEMDKKFWADERCNKCGLCMKVCPSLNIFLDNGKLTWKNQCEQCLACIQWCPQEALQYGKKTPAYPRYHHPEVNIKDLFTH